MKQVSTVGNKTRTGTAATALALSVAASAAVAGVLRYGIHHHAAQLFGPSVYRGCTLRQSIALTFDDGPSEQSLPLIEYLDTQNIRATFFQCGLNILRYPTIARAIYQAGHEIGNHTYSHARLSPRLSRQPNILAPRSVASEFRQCHKIIQSEVGVSPVLLRAPYGLRWFGMRTVQRELGLQGVMWTVIGHDWEWPAAPIAKLVIEKASAGGIICLHDGRDVQPHPDISEMLKALRKIVPVLLDQGYSFETVSDLLKPGRQSAA